MSSLCEVSQTEAVGTELPDAINVGASGRSAVDDRTDTGTSIGDC